MCWGGSFQEPGRRDQKWVGFPNTCLPIYTSHVHKRHSRHTPALTDELASVLVLDTSQYCLLFVL